MSTPRSAIIIGAGIAGPSTALVLAELGIRVTIYEIRAEPGSSGGSITLAPNALRALDQIGVYEQVLAAGYSYEGNTLYFDSGYRLGHVSLTSDKADYKVLRILRSTLQDVLLNACSSKDNIELIRGAKITRITEQADSINAHFEDGRTATADLLFGCDGLHSRVRDYVLDGKSPVPRHIGACTIAAFVPAEEVKLPADFELPCFIFSPTGMIMVVPVDPEAKMLTFGVSETLGERDREGWKQLEDSGEVARIVKEHYGGNQNEPIKSLIDSIDRHPRTLEFRCPLSQVDHLWPPRQLPDLPTWHRGRVLLLADAAHAQPPNAQGSAQALEDAAYLGRLLKSESALARGHEKIFAHFERIRKQRMDVVKKSTKPGAAIKGATPSLLWWAKSWAMTAFFAIKGGKLVYPNSLTSYDVNDESIDVI